MLHRLTALNVRILDRSGSVTDAAESLRPPRRWPIGRWEHESIPEAGVVTLRSDPLGFRALLCRLRDRLIVAGPFIEADARVTPPDSLTADEHRPWALFLESVPQKEPADVDAAACLLVAAGNLSYVRVERGQRDPEQPRSSVDAYPVPTSKEENQTIERRYAAERAIREAIAHGDRDALLAFRQPAPGFVAFADRLPDDPLRLRKNLLIVLNSLGRLSAERGGVLPFELHTLSESHALRIERCRTSRDAESLAPEIIMRYCEAVRSHALTSYSLPVRRAASHILRHLERKLTLDELSALSGCNPTYLSRRFKAETGETITEYIQGKRVAAACWLLEHDGAPITEIAFRVGFADPNYFSRVFRSRMGITARDYRRENLSGAVQHRDETRGDASRHLQEIDDNE